MLTICELPNADLPARLVKKLTATNLNTADFKPQVSYNFEA